jgi:dihydropteroate synthase
MHQKKQMGITNLNQDSIMALSKGQINSINTILNKEQELIKYFKYNIL